MRLQTLPDPVPLFAMVLQGSNAKLESQANASKRELSHPMSQNLAKIIWLLRLL